MNEAHVQVAPLRPVAGFIEERILATTVVFPWSKELALRRQPAPRPQPRDSGRPPLPPAPSRSTTLPHATAHEPTHLAGARPRRLAPRPVDTPPSRARRHPGSAPGNPTSPATPEWTIGFTVG